MTKFHITDDGPKPCRATKRPCPIGGEHLDSLDEAQKVYESRQETFVTHSKVKPTGGKQLDDDKTYMMIDTDTGTIFGENSLVFDAAKLKDFEDFHEAPYAYLDEVQTGDELGAKYIRETDSIEDMENPIIYEPDTDTIVGAQNVRAVVQDDSLDEESLEDLHFSDRGANEYGNKHGIRLFEQSTQATGGKQLDKDKTYMMIDTETGTVFSENALVIDVAKLKNSWEFNNDPYIYLQTFESVDEIGAEYIKDTDSIDDMEDPIIYEPDTGLTVSPRKIRAVEQDGSLDEEDLDELLSSDRLANEYGNKHGVLVFK